MHNILFICWVVIAIAFASTLPQDLVKPSANVTLKENSCITREGENGQCIGMNTCQEFLNINTSFLVQCIKKGYPKNFVCCPSSSSNHSTKNLQKQKREAPPPPPDIPKLRVKGCGVRRSLTDFIVGGRKADFWPWMAAIFVMPGTANSKRFRCGGAVISKHYVLTAAHCVGQTGRTVAANSLSVMIGSVEQSGGQEFPVRSIKVHENYRDILHYDDIALVETSTPMEVKSVVPVCLPTPGMYNANFFQRKAIVLGWGDVNYGGVPSDSLREAAVPVIPSKRCGNRYKRLAALSLPRGIIDTQLCAGAQDGSRDACQGDSGGPLLVEDRSGKWNVVGIVSFGYRCGEPDYPGVYTRVAKYLKWLSLHTDIPARPHP